MDGRGGGGGAPPPPCLGPPPPPRRRLRRGGGGGGARRRPGEGRDPRIRKRNHELCIRISFAAVEKKIA
jgi:hypothetical protein